MRSAASALVALLGLVVLGACGEPADDDVDPDQVDSVSAPELGACRALSIEDVSEPTDATRPVSCEDQHTAQTYAVGDVPDSLREEAWDSPEVARFAYETCSEKLERFLGADESLAMRTLLSWAWFRPSEEAWSKGARWYRCDVVGGSEQTGSLTALPATAEGLLQGRPDDRWLVCVAGPTVGGAVRTPCAQPHDWRAVTTIKLGEPEDDYPGDAVVEARTRDYCSDSVGAWLNYPVDFDYAFTWFHEAEWEVGNRRSVCWARTDR